MLVDPSQIRVLGPLSAFAVGFADELARPGYTLHSARSQMRLMAHRSRWLAGERLGAGDLCRAEIERFLRARRAAGYAQLLSIKACGPCSPTCAISEWPQHHHRPYPPVSWKGCWSGTGTLWRSSEG
jgi:hypothetical protein